MKEKNICKTSLSSAGAAGDASCHVDIDMHAHAAHINSQHSKQQGTREYTLLYPFSLTLNICK